MQVEIINADKKTRYNFGNIWALVQPFYLFIFPFLMEGRDGAYEDDHRLCDQSGSVPG